MDYGRRTADWIREHYDPEVQIGAAPFEGEEFGLRIYRRAGGAAAP